MHIDSKIKEGKEGAKVTLTISIGCDSIRHIRIVAHSIEERDRAMARVRRVLPFIETFEELLRDESPENSTEIHEGAANGAAKG
jgi:hypothetical protein